VPTSPSINSGSAARLREPEHFPLDSRQKTQTPTSATPAVAASVWHRFQSLLASRVSGTSLAVFRIALGLVMLLEVFSLCRPSQSSAGRVPLEVYYTGRDITFNFPYEGFGWLPFLSPLGIHIVVASLALGALGLVLGFLTRTSAILTFATWGYLYALESTRTYWMSYHYLELLALFLILWMPINRCYSIDARRNKDPDKDSSIPFWPLLVLRGQLSSPTSMQVSPS
jgi:vitamin K-dependent gamma-carboxylase